jgi:hypothetical protein
MLQLLGTKFLRPPTGTSPLYSTGGLPSSRPPVAPFHISKYATGINKNDEEIKLYNINAKVSRGHKNNYE